MSTKPDLGPCSWNSPGKKPILVAERTPLPPPPWLLTEYGIDAELAEHLRRAVEDGLEWAAEWVYGPLKAKSTKRRKIKKKRRKR